MSTSSNKIVGIVVREKRKNGEPIYDVRFIGSNHQVVDTKFSILGAEVVHLCIQHGLQVPNVISSRHYSEMNFWKGRARQLASRWTPTEKNNRECSHVVKSIYNTLQQYCQPDRIYKSGSYSKGTQLRGRNELDFLVWVNPNKNWEWTKKCQLQHLRKISNALWNARRDGKIKFWGFQFKGWLITFTTRYRSAIVSVDICITSDAPSAAEYSQMTDSQRRVARTSFAVSSLGYIKDLPSVFKDAIRLLKLWRREIWNFNDKFPSYLFELLVYGEYRYNPQETHSDVIFRACLRKLAAMAPGGNNQRLWYIPNHQYDLSAAQKQWNNVRSNIPIIPDIACIDNNVANIGQDPQTLWKRVASVARETLDRLEELDEVMGAGGVVTPFATWRSEYDGQQYSAKLNDRQRN